jgi:AraC family transcriptional regulator of arabinose operon
MSSRPEMSISQIALDCGFSSYAYYGKCFRRRFGMTPTEFRLSAEQNQSAIC